MGKTASSGKEAQADKTNFPTNTDNRFYSYSPPVIKHYDITADEYYSYHMEIPEAADNIIQKECSLKEAHPLAKIEEIQHTALLLFAGYLDAATSMAASNGGGGSDTRRMGEETRTRMN